MNDLLSTKGKLKDERYLLQGKMILWFFFFAISSIASFALISYILSFFPRDNVLGEIVTFIPFAVGLYFWIRFVIIVIRSFILSLKIMKINFKILKEKRKAY